MGCTAEDAQDFVFLHDDEVFAIKFDFGASVLAEQDAVALFNSQGEDLAFVVRTAFAGRDDFAFLRLVLGLVRDNNAATSGVGFFHTTDQNAVMEWGEFCHSCNSFQIGRRFELG